MRFIANGPFIPDDLLLARDQGRVIFFCGAGVSQAYANLPDFFGLAEKVITHLGVIQDSPAYKLVREAQEIEKRIGLPGVISADRIFGLLERDFLPRDIEKAVASGIKPPPDCDLRAHQILLDLATTPEGAVRLSMNLELPSFRSLIGKLAADLDFDPQLFELSVHYLIFPSRTLYLWSGGRKPIRNFKKKI